MVILQLSKGSLIYRLAYFYGGGMHQDKLMDNLCSVVWRAILGFLIVLLLTTIFTGVSYAVMDTIIWLIVGIIYHFVEPGPASVVVVIISLVAVIYSLKFLFIGVRKGYQAIDNVPVLSDWWNALRNKACVKVVFKA